jgi:uncharacterized membrane protein YfcA
MNSFLQLIAPGFDSFITGPGFFITLVGLGFFIGILAGIFGVGGGFLLVPLMNILLGIPIELAAGSATCYIIGTSTTGVIKHFHKGNIEIKAALYISFGSIAGAIVGDILQDSIVILAGGNKPLFEQIMQGVFVLILLLIAWVMSRESRYDEKFDIRPVTFLQKMRFGPNIDLPGSKQIGVSILGLFGIGFSGGLLTGFMGVSGGVLFMPILVLGVGLAPHLAVGTSLTVVLVGSISAVIKKTISAGSLSQTNITGKISLPIAISLLFAGTIGVRLGMIISHKLHGQKLKKYFSIIVFLAALMVIVKLIFSF